MIYYIPLFLSRGTWCFSRGAKTLCSRFFVIDQRNHDFTILSMLTRLADYNIKIPRMVIKNIAEVVEVYIEVHFSQKLNE